MHAFAYKELTVANLTIYLTNLEISDGPLSLTRDIAVPESKSYSYLWLHRYESCLGTTSTRLLWWKLI